METLARIVEEHPVRKLLTHAIVLVNRSWTKGAFARTAEGCTDVHPRDLRAVSFCAAGAITRASWDLSSVMLRDQAQRLVNKIARQRFGMRIQFVNDELGKTAALSVLEEARRRFYEAD